MRKTAKLAILVAALVALCSLTALAADTWKQEGDQWFCLDSDGNPYYGTWKKSGSNYYYLDDATGAMVTDTLVETDGYKYWCGSDGARVLKKWVQVPVENNDDGFEWMFFKATSGKAAVGDGSSFTSVTNADGVTRKYLFSSEGYMLWGYLADMAGNTADNILTANYYMGPKEEGWQRTGWMKFVDGELGGDYADSSLVYFYIKNSKKITSADHNDDGQYKVSTGKYYSFNDDGALITGYVHTATDASGNDVATSTVYLGPEDDGILKKKVWQKTSSVESTGDTSYWYYFGSDGLPLSADAGTNAQIKKVNGKYYLFSENGRMLTGVAVIYTEDELDPADDSQVTVAKPSDFSVLKDLTDFPLEYNAGMRIYYFSTDADNDGSMKTGAQTISIDGDEATLYFDKHGCAYEGIVNKKIYDNGILQTAGDQKYDVAYLKTRKADDDTKYAYDYFLVNAAGTIINNAKVMDADGIWWYVTATDTNKIYKFCGKDYASQAATAFKAGKTTFTVSSVEYEIYEVSEKSTAAYTYVDYCKK